MKQYVIALLLLTACSNQPVQNKSSNSQRKLPQLIEYSHKYLRDMNEGDEGYYDDHDNFIQDYFSVQYLDRKIVVETVMEVKCIDSIVGKIDVVHDTIHLIREVIMTDDSYCPQLHKFTYTIKNPENRRYTIISRK